MQQVVFTSRGVAESEPARPNWAVISISDVSHGPANLREGWHSVLRLQFYDREEAVLGLRTFDDDMADTVLWFLRSIEDEVDGVLVHCLAGVSRSAGIAKYIADVYGLDFPADYKYFNKLVYHRLKEVAAHQAALRTMPSAG